MAALCPGVQYGLSSQQNFSENKDLIFVRLTDSALRAIEEYIRNPNKSNYQSPRIRFLGNENGELSFPSQHHESGRTLFSFNMSSADDMGGPVGSFECVQGTPPRGNLESLGNVRYKIRVNANEDIYEATRNRMNEVEDKYKNKCTREIKPNQTDIGRRVKVKQPLSHQPQPLSHQPQQPPPPRSSMRDSLLKQPSSYQPSPPVVNKPPLSLSQPSAHSSLSNGLSNGLGSNHVSSSQRSTVQPNRKPSVPEVAKRSLRERLVHLLALRPFKKYELHERLTKEGLRGASSISQVLKQIANLKDNCFYLNRSIWNEVNEDWPFYTETEKQILKRRKPQNLTPPGGSDGGSSGSGQSPTSTHPGSPPLITSTNSINGSGSGTKRPPYNEGCGDGFQYKRPRIAHASGQTSATNGTNKGGQMPPSQQPSGFGDGPFGQRQQTTPEPQYRPSESSYNRSPIEQNNSQRRPITDLRDASNMNPRSRESPPNGFFNSYDNLPVTEDDRNKRQCDSANGLTFGVSREKPFKSASPIHSGLMTEEARRGTSSPVLQNSMSNGLQRDKDKDRRNNNNHKVSSSSHRIARVSPDSQTEGLPLPPQKSPVKEELPKSPVNSIEQDWLDFKKQYVRISSPEQKREYKAEFNKDYTEYKSLYPIVEAVSQRFVRLDELLKRQAIDSPTYKSIKKEIVHEYNKIKKDLEHQKAKKRFQYLHDKLSHIKRLVSDYDQAQTGIVQC